MTTQELLARARSAAGHGAKYRMGAGATKPTARMPFDANGLCDCSAFACWAFGIAKQQAGLAWLKKVNGGWFNTDGVWYDALKEPGVGIFEFSKWADGGGAPHDAMSVGRAIVYPSAWMYARHGPRTLAIGSPFRPPSVGHVGIVTEVKDGKIARVIHCSAGNARRGDAIAETGPSVFMSHPASLLARCVLVTP